MRTRPVLLFAWLCFATPVWSESPPSLGDSPDAERDIDVEVETETEPPLTETERIERLEAELEALKSQVQQQNELPIESTPIVFHGYVDFGFFVPQGGGVGWVQDFGHQRAPDLAQYGWVFLGDILSTAVNTRGEPADLGDAPGVNRFDRVRSKGAPGFIANEANVRLEVGLARNAIVTTSVNFVPRTGSNFSFGDMFDLDIAQLEWLPAPWISVFAGKMESVFGIEYKERRSDTRFGITPSLVQRYTSGTPLGVKARAKFFDELIIFALSATNGSSTIEPFHFYDEIDSNSGKTITGRLSLRLPVDALISSFQGHTLEVGGSGEWGPRDRARDNRGDTWFVGVDLEYRSDLLMFKGQWMRGGSEGGPGEIYGLDLSDSGYLEFNVMPLPFLGAIVRADLRNALVTQDTERAYLTKSWRLTLGLRAVITDHIIIKAEYLRNGEFGEVPEIDNDVFTSALVLRY